MEGEVGGLQEGGGRREGRERQMVEDCGSALDREEGKGGGQVVEGRGGALGCEGEEEGGRVVEGRGDALDGKGEEEATGQNQGLATTGQQECACAGVGFRRVSECVGERAIV